MRAGCCTLGEERMTILKCKECRWFIDKPNDKQPTRLCTHVHRKFTHIANERQQYW